MLVITQCREIDSNTGFMFGLVDNADAPEWSYANNKAH